MTDRAGSRALALRTKRTPRWWRRLPETARVIGPENYDHCAASADVMTPDAALRSVSCAKSRKGHGRWHENRGVVWRGHWKRPIYMTEYIENEVAIATSAEDWTDA